MRLEQIETRLLEINKELDNPNSNIEKLETEINNLVEEKKGILDNAQERKKIANDIANGSVETQIIKRFGDNEMEYNKPIVQDENVEVRALQKYLINGTRDLTDQEQRSLNLSGSAAVVPTNIYNKLITDTKISDLLSRATVINDVGPGKVYIPIASNVAAEWKTENADLITETNTALTKLELGGFELMRVLQLSGAAASMSTGNFEGLMMELLGSEVIETLEKAFISGTGTGQPKGLDKLTWTANTNYIKTSGAAVKITAKDIAEAISLLPQKYARNAVILVNSDMLFQISQFKGTSEYAYNMADGATTFLGKQIIVSEHMADDTVYIVDAKELYVRFSMPLQIEADRSIGFRSASIYLRALCVVDAVFNPAAAVKVGLGA